MITKDIERKLAKLAALEDGGVDNWDFYDESLKEYRATIERDEMAESLVDEICEALCEAVEEPAGRGCGYGFRGAGIETAVQIVLAKVKEFK